MATSNVPLFTPPALSLAITRNDDLAGYEPALLRQDCPNSRALYTKYNDEIVEVNRRYWQLVLTLPHSELTAIGETMATFARADA